MNESNVLGVASNSVHSMVSVDKQKQTLTKFGIVDATHDVLSSAVGNATGSIGNAGSMGDDYRKSLPNTVENDTGGETKQMSVDAQNRPGAIRVTSKNGRRMSSMGAKEGFMTTGSGYDS